MVKTMYTKIKQVSITYRIFYKDGKACYCQRYFATIDSVNIVKDVKNYLTHTWSNQLQLNYGEFNNISHIKLITIDGMRVNEIITRA